MAAAPTAVLAWSGCSTSSSSRGSAGVDPGGTYGAEVILNVVGKGSVLSSIPGINCPGSCSTRVIFKDLSQAGAIGGIGLRAITTSPAVRFAGWSFESTPLGAKGRGPEACNPITRAGALPSVNTQTSEITLPYGTTQGSAPSGHEGECSGQLDVPVGYKVTATFVDTTIPDAGPDGDAGAPDVLFQPPVAGAVARYVGHAGGYLYWLWDQPNGDSGVSSAYVGGSSPVAAQIVTPAQAITQFVVAAGYVVYQTEDGDLHVIPAGGTNPTNVVGGPACAALWSDYNYAYCRSTTRGMFAWTGSGPAGAIVADGILPSGTDLWADTSSSGYLYYSDTAAGTIYRISKTTVVSDGGAFSPTTMHSGQTSPASVVGNSSRLWWINGQLTAWADSSPGSSVYPVVSASTGMRVITPDTSSSYAYIGTADAILRGYYYNTSTPTPTTLRAGLNQVTSIAVDGSYVYWTVQNDGRVFRAYKN